jgi:hypothetical protein
MQFDTIPVSVAGFCVKPGAPKKEIKRTSVFLRLKILVEVVLIRVYNPSLILYVVTVTKIQKNLESCLLLISNYQYIKFFYKVFLEISKIISKFALPKNEVTQLI